MSGLHAGPGGQGGAVNGAAAARGTEGAPPGFDALRAPMPVDLAIRILRRAGVAEDKYDCYSVVEGPVVALFVAYGQGAVTGAGPVDLYAGPEAFEEEHLRRTGRAALPAGRPLPGVVGALRTGRDRTLRYDYGTLPEFRRRVLEAVRGVPRGQLRPVEWLGAEAGVPGATTAELLEAVRSGPAPVLIPVHRLSDEDGRLVDCGLPTGLVERLRAHESIDEERLGRFAAAGTHYLGSGTTRIFCYPTCAHARRITDRHRVPFGSVAAARGAGYRPCLSCRPVAA